MLDGSPMQSNGEDNEQVPYPVRAATEPVEPVFVAGASKEGFWEVEGIEEKTNKVSEE